MLWLLDTLNVSYFQNNFYIKRHLSEVGILLNTFYFLFLLSIYNTCFNYNIYKNYNIFCSQIVSIQFEIGVVSAQRFGHIKTYTQSTTTQHLFCRGIAGVIAMPSMHYSHIILIGYLSCVVQSI